MAFPKTTQAFNAAINTLQIGTGDKAITIGGENVYQLYSFDAPIENSPKVGIQISDLGTENEPECLKSIYSDCATVADIAKKAAAVDGVDFLCLSFDGADPNGQDKPVEECAEIAKSVADAVDLPLVIMGSSSSTKDASLFEKVSDALQGKNILVLSAKEENYKTVGAAAGLAYGQKVGAESSVDINLAKQLNVLLTQLGVDGKTIAMNLGTAAAGYGFEYVASTIERVKAAALAQNDTSLQMPVILPVANDAWGVKEAMASEEDFPEWGSVEDRGINMEITTATAVLAAGADAVIVKHPVSVATVSGLIKELM